MTEINNYDPNEEFFVPSPGRIYELLQSPEMAGFDFDTIRPGRIPSSSSISSSSSQLGPEIDNIFTHQLETTVNNDGFVLRTSNVDPTFDAPITNPIETLLNEYKNDALHVIDEPKRYYRARYPCEIDQLKCRAKRFIRAENNDNKHEYPTIKFPSTWFQSNRQLFIRVTLVTVPSEQVPFRCIHPYEIDTSETDIIKDPANNSIYFRINESEFKLCEKSFRIIVKKMKQDELKVYGPIRAFDCDQHLYRNIQNTQDAKQKILLYQLSKSQFVFTFAERFDNNDLPTPMPKVSVQSQIMIDTAAEGRHALANYLNGTSTIKIKCVPQKGDWGGCDEVVMIMPTPVKQKAYKISFGFGRYGQQVITDTNINYIDTKTILFRTPACPVPQGNQNLPVFITVHENNILIQQIEFIYLTSSRTTNNICPFCQGVATTINGSNKRRYGYNGFDQTSEENDGIDSLVEGINKVSIEQTTAEPRSRVSSLASADEYEAKFDKYLNQLKDALTIFVRTNDPSRLFRRTRVLLSKFDENSSPLSDAIEGGHVQLALPLIEQVIDMPSPNRLLEKGNENGETPLLIAAKLNHGKLIETILKKRSDLVEQKDKDGNNIFHLLANLSEDKGAETMENILTILPNESKINLLKETNTKNETPLDIARSHGNTKFIDLFESSSIDVQQNN